MDGFGGRGGAFLGGGVGVRLGFLCSLMFILFCVFALSFIAFVVWGLGLRFKVWEKGPV